MTRATVGVTAGDGDDVEFDQTSDSKLVQAVVIRTTDDPRVSAPITSAGFLVRGSIDHPTTGIADGRKEVAAAGTREALATSTAAKWVTITAEEDNTDAVVVGSASTVVAALATRRGTPLLAGDTITIPCDNLADIGLDAMVSGEGVTFVYGT